MKRVVLMRHAEAQLEQYGQPDKDRAITINGMHELDRLRPKLSQRLVGIDFCLCSNAKRTRQTLDSILPILPTTAEVAHNDDIYKTTPQKLWGYIQNLNKKNKGIMIIAHNPGITQFLQEVAEANNIKAPTHFPTCSVAICETDQKDWRHVNAHTLTLKALLYP